MLTIIVAPDSFKGSLSARDAAMAMERGVRDAAPEAQVVSLPLSDGGEGLVEILTDVLHGQIEAADVHGPLPEQRVSARWGWVEHSRTAVIEMAQAAGLGLVPAERRDPKVTTTYGVGELIRLALDRGAASMIIGIGGSATNDGGAGMAEALGVAFLDKRGMRLPRGGAALSALTRCDRTRIDQRLARASIRVACDVRNPLLGQNGASAVYAVQKGASRDDVALLDEALTQFRKVVLDETGLDVQAFPGSGAAGGLGAGLMAFCGAELQSGITIVLDAVEFDVALERADLVITGEGKLDVQTHHGKVVAGVVERCQRKRVPVAAVVGMRETPNGEKSEPESLGAVFTLVAPGISMDEAIRNAPTLLRARTRELVEHFLTPHQSPIRRR